MYCPSVPFTFLLPFSRFLALDISLFSMPLLLLLLPVSRVGDSSPAKGLIILSHPKKASVDVTSAVVITKWLMSLM
jgi:hypothetical protein